MNDIIQITGAEYGEMFLLGLIVGLMLAALLAILTFWPRSDRRRG